MRVRGGEDDDAGAVRERVVDVCLAALIFPLEQYPGR
jgi:hypothetical protein